MHAPRASQYKERESARVSASGMLLCLLGAMVLLSAMAAYSIVVPLPFYALVPAGIACVYMWLRGGIEVPSYLALVLFYMSYAALVQIWHLIAGVYSEMPNLATTPYYLFIATRYVSIFGFVLSFVCAYGVALRAGVHSALEVLSFCLGAVVVAGLYIYAAQRLGYWEPPRTRMGTGGQDFAREGVRFSYAFFRAIGTFREPSHLAQWMGGLIFLLLPLGSVRALVIGALAILLLGLTGSALGLISLTAGTATALLLRARRLSAWLMALAGVVLLGLISYAADMYLGGALFGAMSSRIGAFLEGGIMVTNRDYVWAYAAQVQPPLFGWGLGNANLQLSAHLGIPLVASHLNILLNAWFSGGAIGVLLVAAILIAPFVHAVQFRTRLTFVAQMALCGHAAWVAAYMGNAEELALLDAVCLGVFYASIRRGDSSRS